MIQKTKDLLRKIPLIGALVRSHAWQSRIYKRTLKKEERTNAFSTAFLRCPHQYRALVGPVMDYILDKNTEPLNIIVVGCSSGAEAYSIASEIMRHRPETKFAVKGFDIEQRVLDVGRGGKYTKEQVFKNTLIDDKFVNFTFDQINDGYAVKSEIASRVTFDVANALDDDLIDKAGASDIIYAQNFLYHLEPELAERAFANMYRLLKPRAALFLDGMDLELKIKLTRKHNLNLLDFLIEETHEDGRVERGDKWPHFYWGLEPLSKSFTDWKERYGTVFTTTPRATSTDAK